MRRGGKIQFNVNGIIYLAKGEFTYHLGTAKRDAVIGSDRPHGFKETQQVAYIEGALTDDPGLDVATLRKITGASVTLQLGVGKTIVLSDAYEASDGTGKSEEGELAVRFESANEGQEI